METGCLFLIKTSDYTRRKRDLSFKRIVPELVWIKITVKTLLVMQE